MCGSLNILRHCLSLELEWKLTFSRPVITAALAPPLLPELYLSSYHAPLTDPSEPWLLGPTGSLPSPYDSRCRLDLARFCQAPLCSHISTRPRTSPFQALPHPGLKNSRAKASAAGTGGGTLLWTPSLPSQLCSQGCSMPGLLLHFQDKKISSLARLEWNPVSHHQCWLPWPTGPAQVLTKHLAKGLPSMWTHGQGRNRKKNLPLGNFPKIFTFWIKMMYKPIKAGSR